MALVLLLLALIGCKPPEGAGHDSPAAECTPVDYFPDADGDGFGGGTASACDPEGSADVGGDCDDADGLVNPGVETDECNGVDDDCDGTVDEDAPLSVFYLDEDGDGWGLPEETVEACAVPPGYAASWADCNDDDPFVNGADPENWTNGVDDNCDGIVEIETPIEVVGSNPYERPWDAPTDSPTKLRYLDLSYVSEVHIVHDVPESVVLLIVNVGNLPLVIEETYPGTIARVIVYTWHGKADVKVPYGVLVDEVDGPGPFMVSTSTWDSKYVRAKVAAAEAVADLPLTSFHYVTSSSEVVIRPVDEWMDTSAYPDCSKPTASAPGGLPDPTAITAKACAKVLESKHVCVTGGASLDVLGLDDGTSCEAVTSDDESFSASISGASIAWSGEYVYICAGSEDMLQRVSLRDGSIEKAYVWCDAVASFDDGRLYVVPEEIPPGADVPVFASWGDVRCGTPSSYVSKIFNTRVAIDGDLMYSAWHSTREYSWLDMVSGAEDTITLDRMSDWIYGIDVTDDGWFVLTAPGETQWFDAASGDRIGTMPVTGSGLACATQ